MSERRPIKLIVCLVAGFTQHRLEPHGLAALHERLCKEYHDRRESIIMLESWDTCPKLLAAKIAQHHQPGVQLAMASFSWGGPTIVNTCKQLAEHNISVNYWAAIDPVPRLRDAWFSPVNLWAMTRLGSITVPDNVRVVSAWRQINGRPLGREIKTGAKTTVAMRGVYGPAGKLAGLTGNHWYEPAVVHEHMQDRPEIHAHILEHIAALKAAA